MVAVGHGARAVPRSPRIERRDSPITVHEEKKPDGIVLSGSNAGAECISVRIDCELDNMKSSPEVPTTLQLGPGESRVLVTLSPTDPKKLWRYNFRWHWVPCSDNAGHPGYYEYEFPWRSDDSFQALRNAGGGFNHFGQALVMTTMTSTVLTETPVPGQGEWIRGIAMRGGAIFAKVAVSPKGLIAIAYKGSLPREVDFVSPETGRSLSHFTLPSRWHSVYALAFDQSGDLFVAGEMNRGCAIARFSLPGGAPRWIKLFPGPGKAWSRGVTMVTGTHGRIVLGSQEQAAAKTAVSIVRSLNADTGEMIWERRGQPWKKASA